MFWDDPAFGLMRSGSKAFRGRTFPAFTVHPRLGWELAATLEEPGGSVTIRLDPVAASPVPTENVAWFSSFGSGADWTTAPDRDFSEQDVRFKPDMVAPGYALSAASDSDFTPGSKDKCAVVRALGTVRCAADAVCF
jgi:hypothetical protein